MGATKEKATSQNVRDSPTKKAKSSISLGEILLVRSYLLCPYSDCEAHNRHDTPRIKIEVDENRNINLSKTEKETEKEHHYLTNIRNGRSQALVHTATKSST